MNHCEIHPLYFPKEGPPKGFRAFCIHCLQLYIAEMRNTHEQLVMDTLALRDTIEESGHSILLQEYDLLLEVMQGDHKNDRSM